MGIRRRRSQRHTAQTRIIINDDAPTCGGHPPTPVESSTASLNFSPASFADSRSCTTSSFWFFFVLLLVLSLVLSRR